MCSVRLFVLSELYILSSSCSKLVALLSGLEVALYSSSVTLTCSSNCAEVSSLRAFALESGSWSVVTNEELSESSVEALAEEL